MLYILSLWIEIWWFLELSLCSYSCWLCLCNLLKIFVDAMVIIRFLSYLEIQFFYLIVNLVILLGLGFILKSAIKPLRNLDDYFLLSSVKETKKTGLFRYCWSICWFLYLTSCRENVIVGLKSNHLCSCLPHSYICCIETFKTSIR